MQSTTNSRTSTLPEDETHQTERRTADVLIDVLVEAGVNVVFGLPGGTIAPLHDALLDRPEIRVITSRHESGAMFAAAGYARMSGRIGVVMVTSGPGVLNAITGLASAYCDGLPILLLAGEVPRAIHGRRALQEGSAHHLDIVGMCRHVSKLAAEIPFSNLAPAFLKRAIATALSGRRGPAVLTLPLDVTSASIRPPELAADVTLTYELQSAGMTRAIGNVANALRGASRPVIFAGSGSRWGTAPARLRDLAERLQIPVMTTPKGKGVFPESHPLSLGVFGHAGHPSARRYLEDGIDTLLAVGTGLSDPATDGWSPLLSPTKHFIQIDADALQLGRNYPVTHGIVGDAEGVLRKLIEQTGGERREARRYGVERFMDAASYEHGPEDRITPQRALWELQQVMPKDTIYTCDIGEHMLFATHYLEIDDPRGFMMMTGLASMGSSIPSAIGAKLSCPDRAVVAICGDGGFSMTAADVAVAGRLRMPLVIAVLNDMRYGMVEIGNRAVYGRSPCYSTAPLSVRDLTGNAMANSISAERSGDILRLDLPALLEAGPVVIDIRIDRRVQMPKNKRFEELRAVVRKRVFN
jgi:acetolactate synthase I/II/III large subunit